MPATRAQTRSRTHTRTHTRTHARAHARRYVRNTTARAFSVVASALGIPALLPFLKAVCQSKKSWQVVTAMSDSCLHSSYILNTYYPYSRSYSSSNSYSASCLIGDVCFQQRARSSHAQPAGDDRRKSRPVGAAQSPVSFLRLSVNGQPAGICVVALAGSAHRHQDRAANRDLDGLRRSASPQVAR